MLQITATTPDERELCPIRNVLASLSGKWQPLILFALEDAPLRFSAIRRAIGDVTQRVLTENLRNLERDGYLTRHVDPGPPVAVEYRLTPMGLSLCAVLRPYVEWASDSYPAVRAARAAYDARTG